MIVSDILSFSTTICADNQNVNCAACCHGISVQWSRCRDDSATDFALVNSDNENNESLRYDFICNLFLLKNCHNLTYTDTPFDSVIGANPPNIGKWQKKNFSP